MSILQAIYNAVHSPIGLIVLASVLVIGMAALWMRPAGNLSQRLMRWRIGLQFAAILILLGLFLINR